MMYRDFKALGLLTLLAFLSQWVYAFSTSFLYDTVLNFDQGIFETIGKCWAEGGLPYVDAWDSKGPIIFFFNMLGYLLGGRTGVFWIEVVNMSLCLYALYFFMVRRSNVKYALVTCVLTLCAYCTISSGGNQVSDYSLLLAFASSFAFYDWANRLQEKRVAAHPLGYGVIYGLYFGCSLMSRLTNAAALCLMIMIVFFVLLRKKAWRNLLANIVGFLLGVAVVVLPFWIYFAAKDAADDMWYATLFYNIEYAIASDIEQTVSSPSKIVYFVLYFAPIFSLFIVAIANILWSRGRKQINLFWLIISLGVLAWLYKSYANANYGIGFVPFVAVAALELRHLVEEARWIRGIGWGLVGLVLVAFINQTRVFPSHIRNEKATYHTILKGIEPSFKQSFVAYNYEPDIYLSLDITPAYRFFVCQDWAIENGASLLPLVRKTYNEGNANWILVQNYETCKIKDILLKRYRVYRTDEANHLVLFKRK